MAATKRGGKFTTVVSRSDVVTAFIVGVEEEEVLVVLRGCCRSISGIKEVVKVTNVRKERIKIVVNNVERKAGTTKLVLLL